MIHALRQECIRRDIRIQHTDSESEDLGPYDDDEDEGISKRKGKGKEGSKGKVDSKGDNHKILKGDGKGKMTGGISKGKGKGKGKDTGIVNSIQKKGGHGGIAKEKGKGKGKQRDGKGEDLLKGGKDKGKGNKEGKGKDNNDKGKTAHEARENMWKEVGAVKLTAREAAVLAKAEEVTKEHLEKERKRKGKGNGKGKAKGDDADEALGKADKAGMRLFQKKMTLAKASKGGPCTADEDDDGNKGKGSPSDSPSAKRNVPRGTADALLRPKAMSKRLPVSGIIDDGDVHQDGLEDDEDGDGDDVAKEPDDSQPAEPEDPSDPVSGSPPVLRATAREQVPQWLLPPPPVLRATAKCNTAKCNVAPLLPVRAKRGREWT